MYLKKLSGEQKELFLDMAILAAMANNVFEDSEKELINQYCEEMQISEARYDTDKTFDAVIDRLADISSKADLKMMAIELYALLVVDESYDESEQDFMKKIIEKSGITEEEYVEIKDMVDTLNYAYGKLENLITR